MALDKFTDFQIFYQLFINYALIIQLAFENDQLTRGNIYYCYGIIT